MTEEEKKAIEWINKIVNMNKKDNIENSYAEIALNLIEKQQKELELKDKIIDEMAEFINQIDKDEEICKSVRFSECIANDEYTNCNECVIQHFINKVKENKE